MAQVLENFRTFTGGTWQIVIVVVCLSIAWYILSMALEAYRQGNVKKTFEGIVGWVTVIVFSMCIAIPMTMYMIGSVFDQVSDSDVLHTMETTVNESARFAVDMTDGDGTVTMPNIPKPSSRGGEPNVIRTVQEAVQPTPVVQTIIVAPPANPNAAPTLVPWTPPTPVGQGPPVINQVTVARGDTLYKIATRVYGNGEHWRRLCQHNFNGNQRACDNLRVGQVINIPQ